MMDPDIKAKWLEALRSGKYQQGRRALRTADERFCCLGVLCDLVSPDRWGSKDELAGQYRFAQMWSYLPTDLSESISISDFEMRTLAEMNDRGDSFSMIADHIEANL